MTEIPADKMAEITVEVARILRKHGVDCRYNESLNCLQDVLATEYIDNWLDRKVDGQPGAYDYWEAAHKRVGISRPKDTR